MHVSLYFPLSAHAFPQPQYRQSFIQSSCRTLYPFAMPSSPISIGKRPEFKYSKSAGWSWPRLVPIQDQQSRLSQASQPSASPSLPEHSEQGEQPPTMISPTISKVDAVEDAPLSPISSAAGRSPTAGESVTEAVNHQPKEHRHSISSAADSIPASIPEPDIEDIGIPIGRYASSLSLYAKGVAKNDDSEAADVSASAAERGPIEDAANQGGSQIPVVDESTSMYLQRSVVRSPNVLTSPIQQSLKSRTRRKSIRHHLQRRYRLLRTEPLFRQSLFPTMRHQR